MAEEAESARTVVGLVDDVSRRLITALPPAFLLLVLLNVVFLGCVMWFLNSQMEQRTGMINSVVDRCMEIAWHATAPAGK